MHFAAEDFIHPEDRAAREQLEAIPGFGRVVKAAMRPTLEQLLHGLNMAQKLRLGPQQLPEIYGMLPPICEQLGIQEPEFYLEMSPIPNAYAIGDTRTAVTVTSAMLELVEPDELRAVIAHECGHIVCRHMLYHTMAQLMRWGGDRLGLLGVFSRPIEIGLNYWVRRSEFSADRASAVVMGGSEPVIELMIRAAAGPKALTKSVNVELYLAQAEAYDEMTRSSGWDKLLQNAAIMDIDHPFNAVRAREIHRWTQTDQYRRLMRASQTPSGGAAGGIACLHCGKPVQVGWRFCQACGAALTPTAG